MMKNILTVVVIGKNEGERLESCLEGIKALGSELRDARVLYVDSESTDNSVATAKKLGAEVIALKGGRMTAARARNEGLRYAKTPFILFLDGDVELQRGFVTAALNKLGSSEIAAVSGRLREREPAASLYQYVLDLDWNSLPGEVEYCGGNALVRRDVLLSAGGFRDDLVAGEEPELYRRVSSLRKKVVSIDVPMALHDLEMSRWSQYWERNVRTGYAYAQLARMTRSALRPLWVKESRHNLIKVGLSLLFVIICAASAAFRPEIVLAIPAALIALAVRTGWRERNRSRNPIRLFLYGIHAHLQHVPICWGQIRFLLSRIGMGMYG
jgi:glycosyltransferase involved in cell wall biosynthesis